ncbi:hypothetical protein BC829DRAFT_151910 [Chytridium lagenaria]|nr:hypothetical protein BC829DRAFT_151910 [Chytridium lagenaria]
MDFFWNLCRLICDGLFDGDQKAYGSWHYGEKGENPQYRTYESFVEDFRLVYKNAMTYNSPDTLYYRNAEKLGQYGNAF